MLFDKPEVSDLNVSFWEVLVPAVSALAIFGGIVVYAVGRSLGRRQESGVSELIGMLGTASTPLDPGGTVAIRGEFWNARARQPVLQGDRVEVVEVKGLELVVRRVEPQD